MRKVFTSKQIPFLALLIALMSCQTSGQKEKATTEAVAVDYSKSVFYEIFVQSFADSDGDGIGDIAGMTSKIGLPRGFRD